MKITLEQKGIKAIIESENDDLDLLDVLEILIKPALLGIGFQPDTVNRLTIQEDED